ncbi:MAG: 50S ribosomal protein L18 [Proteobacteria bacterium]|nr:50S ribosomal protein L18 [Pseudomonadota bacterium]
MADIHKKSTEMRLRRRRRIRGRLRGSSDRPRLAFFKSSRHVYVQVIDDDKGVTLTSVHSLMFKDKKDYSWQRAGCQACKALGQELAQRCGQLGIQKVVFDRGGFPYHGRIESFADAARENGLVF